MIQISAQMRVLVAIEPVDGRKGIDSLARLCQDKLAEDPFSGSVFVFRSRSGTPRSAQMRIGVEDLSDENLAHLVMRPFLARGR